MPTIIAQHTVATFTSPVNGTTPIDANTVRGNDNTIRQSYNNHDSDPGIHVQSSTLASRPAAGTAGRKWITADAGSYKLWYDDGTRWHEVGNDIIDVEVLADENLVKGDVVMVTGYNVSLNIVRVAKFDGNAPAFGVANETIANGNRGYIVNTGLISGIDTTGYGTGSAPEILYPSASTKFTVTKPVSGQYQVVAYLLRNNASNGVLYVEFSAPRIVERSDNTVSTVVLRDGSGNFAAGTITAALAGNASTATALQNVRTLWGQNFDGTANVTGALTGVTDLTASGTITAVTFVGALTGNASTATALQNTRTLWGQNFNGTANVTGALTGVTDLTASGTITATTFVGAVTGNASTATALQNTRTLWGQNFNGTANVTGDLTSVGNITGTAGVTLQATSGTLALAATGANVITAATNGVERFRINGSGNVGIGVTPSAWTTYQAVQIGSGTPVAIDSSGAIGFNYFFDGAYKYVGSSSSALYSFATGQHRWYTAPSGTAGNAITFTQAMTLDASGNLGLGTASPSSKLHIVGAGSVFGQITSGTNQVYVGWDDGGSNGTLQSNSGLAFMTGATFTERLRITSTGLVGIGLTSPNVALEVAGSIHVSGGDRTIFNRSNNSLAFGTNNTERVRITSDGNVVVGGAAPTVSGGTLFGIGNSLFFVGKLDLSSPYTENLQIDIVWNNWGANNVVGLVDIDVTLREWANTAGVAFGRIFATNTNGAATFSTFNTTNVTTSQCTITASSGGNYTLRITIDPSNNTDIMGFLVKIPGSNGGTGVSVSSITASLV